MISSFPRFNLFSYLLALFTLLMFEKNTRFFFPPRIYNFLRSTSVTSSVSFIDFRQKAEDTSNHNKVELKRDFVFIAQFIDCWTTHCS